MRLKIVDENEMERTRDSARQQCSKYNAVVILYLFFFSIEPEFFNEFNQYFILRQS